MSNPIETQILNEANQQVLKLSWRPLTVQLSSQEDGLLH